MSCPWAKIEKSEPVNLAEIMSEEVAKDLQAKKDQMDNILLGKSHETAAPSPSHILYDTQLADEIPDEVLKAISNGSIESDAASILFENFRSTSQDSDFESDSEEELECIRTSEDLEWDRFDMLQRDIDAIQGRRYKVQQKDSLITKHDLSVRGAERKAYKLLSFQPKFLTVDGKNFDVELSNKVFNSLKLYSNRRQVRRCKVHDQKEEHATAEFGLDKYTGIVLYNIVNAQLLKRINGVISMGEKAVILHAETDFEYSYSTVPPPKECVIKVFKTTSSAFKYHDKYITDDHRFNHRAGKQNSKKIVHSWAEKEMANLGRLKRAGLHCPQVITLNRHILVMTFIGENHRPAPKLKDVQFFTTDVDLILAYEQVVDGMKTMYHQANLIHADLSENTILWHNEQCYFIDVSQSVEPSHENAFHFLYWDCYNIILFFKRLGAPKLPTPDDLFEDIVGTPFTDKVALSSIQESFKMKPDVVDKPGVESSCTFDTAWEKANGGEMSQVDKMLQVELSRVDELPRVDGESTKELQKIA